LGFLSQKIVTVPLGGSISLLPTGAYYTEVTVGTPPQTLLSLLDSGSSDFIASTTICTSCGKPTTYEYNLQDSTTLKYLPCTGTHPVVCMQCINNTDCGFLNEYITCVANNPDQVCIMEGPIVNDVFAIPETNLSVNVNFGAITFSNITLPGPMTALWGLSYQKFTYFNETGPLEALADSGQIADIFSLCILQENGTFTLGGTDSRFYLGTIQYTPFIDTQGFGVYTLDVQISRKSLGFNSSIYNIGGASIVDSGTFSILFPSAVYQTISTIFLESCPKSGLVGVCDLNFNQTLFAGNCFNMTLDEVERFPTFQILLAQGVEISVGPLNYLVPTLNNPSTYCWGFQDGGSQSLTIYGDVALKRYYSVFDKQHQQFGIAKANVFACANPKSL